MRYVAASTTLLPDGRIILAGVEYDYPKDDTQVYPETISEIASKRLEEDLQMEAKQRGEPPRIEAQGVVEKRPRGWPKGKPRKVVTV
jgi:hypothetical protein